MRVLVACEYSGRVRDAFISRGHDALSCDLLPTEVPGPHHQGDVFEAHRLGPWDLVVAHPPCTYLTNSGVRWLYGGKGDVRDENRWMLMDGAAWFFAAMLAVPAPRVAVENPIMHSHGRSAVAEHYRAMTGRHVDDDFRRQTIQPWQFGHGETKATVLWIKGLPELRPTNLVAGREQRVHKMAPGPERWKERSRTFTGIAEAMAEQWGTAQTLWDVA